MKLIVFTDLDGTLLDHHTYDYRPALPALKRLKALGAAVVLASSKTWAEMAPLHEAMELTEPLIAEGGGGIFAPPGHPVGAQGQWQAVPGGWKVLALGKRLEEFAPALAELKRRYGAQGFSDMDPAEIARLTGLRLAEAQRAAQRLFSEPVVISQENQQAFMAEAEAVGLSVRKGGRFVLVSGGANKGVATHWLLKWYRKGPKALKSIALGDAPNDEDMLAVVDIPVLLARHDGSFAPLKLPGLRKVSPGGPKGWAKAIEQLLKELQEP